MRGQEWPMLSLCSSCSRFRGPAPQLPCDSRQATVLSGLQVGSFVQSGCCGNSVVALPWFKPGSGPKYLNDKIVYSLPSGTEPDPRAFLEGGPETFLA